MSNGCRSPAAFKRPPLPNEADGSHPRTFAEVLWVGCAQESCPLGLATGGEDGVSGADAAVFEAEAKAVDAALREQAVLAAALQNADGALFGGNAATAARAPKPGEPEPLAMQIDYKLNYLLNSGNAAKANLLRRVALPSSDASDSSAPAARHPAHLRPRRRRSASMHCSRTRPVGCVSRT